MSDFVLEFEKPIRELEGQIAELKDTSLGPEIDLTTEIKALQKKVTKLVKDIYSNLTSWERVQLSRHPNRPHSIDFINYLFKDFHEVYGDRCFSNDPAVISGFGYLDGKRVCVIAIEKGRKTKEKVHHNFGMPRPEGYRKALRIMKMAGRFGIPIISFIDTPGAYPGIGAEERGQAQAIAENLTEMFDISSPIISVVIGEGGSGGALGIGIGDQVLMMEYSVYSVISPESCASILWADPKKADIAANSLQLGPHKALELGVVDALIAEPAGGAHRSPDKAMENVKGALLKAVGLLENEPVHSLKELRYQKFRKMGNSTLRS